MIQILQPSPARDPTTGELSSWRVKARDLLGCNYRVLNQLVMRSCNSSLYPGVHLRVCLCPRLSALILRPLCSASPESSARDPEGKGSEREDLDFVFPRFHSDARRVLGGACRRGAEGDERGYLRTAPLSQ